MNKEQQAFKMPSTFAAMLGVLLAISLMCGSLLAITYAVTKDQIALVEQEKTKSAFVVVMPGFDNDPLAEKVVSSTEPGVALFPLRKGAELLGYAVATLTDKGYSGRIELMIGIKNDGSITRYQVTKANETPGLGTNISSPDFQKQFEGKNPETFNLSVRKDGGQVDAISAATISSRAVCDAIARAYRVFSEVKQ